MTNEKVFVIIYGSVWANACKDEIAAMAQLVEHILGKDEVPGPNPGSSSRQPRRETFGALVFYRLFRDFCGSTFCFWGCLELLLSLRIVLCGKATESGSHTPHEDQRACSLGEV